MDDRNVFMCLTLVSAGIKDIYAQQPVLNLGADDRGGHGHGHVHFPNKVGKFLCFQI